jgi:hypothetical protein
MWCMLCVRNARVNPGSKRTTASLFYRLIFRITDVKIPHWILAIFA